LRRHLTGQGRCRSGQWRQGWSAPKKGFGVTADKAEPVVGNGVLS